MIIGSGEYFTKEHFEKHKGYAPAYLAELVVYCFELLSQLSYLGIGFRFKGGNSMLLLVEPPERFSIDIDIATTEPKEKLIQAMETVNRECEAFTKLEIRQHQTKPWLPMISFKIYFDSMYQKPEDSYVMLDAVLKKSPYDGFLKKIKVGEIYESTMEVEIPTPSGLIGDKLLTLGPSTLGIPIGKGKEAQRLKHVFDISKLWGLPIEKEKILQSVNNCMKQENEIQNSNFTLKEVIEDTVLFCSKPLKYDTIPEIETVEDDKYLYEIAKGFPDFKKHLFRTDYTWDLLKRDMKRVEEVAYSLIGISQLS